MYKLFDVSNYLLLGSTYRYLKMVYLLLPIPSIFWLGILIWEYHMDFMLMHSDFSGFLQNLPGISWNLFIIWSSFFSNMGRRLGKHNFIVVQFWTYIFAPKGPAWKIRGVGKILDFFYQKYVKIQLLPDSLQNLKIVIHCEMTASQNSGVTLPLK